MEVRGHRSETKDDVHIMEIEGRIDTTVISKSTSPNANITMSPTKAAIGM